MPEEQPALQLPTGFLVLIRVLCGKPKAFCDHCFPYLSPAIVDSPAALLFLDLSPT